MTIHGVTTLDPLRWAPPAKGPVRLWDCGVTWADLNPAPGRYEWARLDAIVDSLPGRDIMLTIAGTPQWAAREPQSSGAPWLPAGSNSPPHTMSDWTAFIGNVARRYTGRITSYQIWNEPQNHDFWAPIGQVSMLGPMTAKARRIVDAIDSSAKIIGAQVMPRASSGGMRRASGYLEALAASGWPIDVHTASVYPEPGKAVAAWESMILQWKAGLVRAGAPRRPLWVAETNFNLQAGPLEDPIALARLRGTGKAANAVNVARVYWYAWGVHGNPKVLGIPLHEGTKPGKALQLLMEKEA
jgi:hypothetical protein